MEFLVAHVMQRSAVQNLQLVHCPRVRQANGTPNALCPCDNGPNNCVTAVPLKNIRFRLEGWLLAELHAGQCPHCLRVYWG